jgi:peptidoglycan/LPS O-acetylase OafA/YrhL
MPNEVAWQRSFPALAVAFTPGIVLSALEHVVVPRWKDRTGRARLVSWLLLAVGVLILIPYDLMGGRLHDFTPRLPAPRPLLAALSMGCLLGAALAREWAGLGWRPSIAFRGLAAIGARSYSFYLLHAAVLFEFTHFARALSTPKRFVVICFVVFPVILVISAVFYRFVEAPALRWAKSGMWRREVRQAPVIEPITS